MVDKNTHKVVERSSSDTYNGCYWPVHQLRWLKRLPSSAEIQYSGWPKSKAQQYLFHRSARRMPNKDTRKWVTSSFFTEPRNTVLCFVACLLACAHPRRLSRKAQGRRKTEEMPAPTRWPEETGLAPGDVVATVEHCTGCARHRMSLSHNADVYM